jgi:hypothetical protein
MTYESPFLTVLGPLPDPKWQRFIAWLALMTSPIPIVAAVGLTIRRDPVAAIVGGLIFWLLLIIACIQLVRVTQPRVRRAMREYRESHGQVVSVRRLVVPVVVAAPLGLVVGALIPGPGGVTVSFLVILFAIWLVLPWLDGRKAERV